MFLKILETKKISPFNNTRIYALYHSTMNHSAKVHKIVTDGLPSFRPILSAIDTPTCKLAKFLVPMLEPLTTNEDLTPSGSKTWSYAWFSYKVHKIVTDGLPSFRPILSAIGTPTYTIKDSFAFAEELQSFDSKLVMASSDVESLFTNIHLQETGDVWVENLFKDRSRVDNLSKDSFRELLTRTVSEWSCKGLTSRTYICQCFSLLS